MSAAAVQTGLSVLGGSGGSGGGGLTASASSAARSTSGDIYAEQNSSFIVGGESDKFDISSVVPWIVLGIVGIAFVTKR